MRRLLDARFSDLAWPGTDDSSKRSKPIENFLNIHIVLFLSAALQVSIGSNTYLSSKLAYNLV